MKSETRNNFHFTEINLELASSINLGRIEIVTQVFHGIVHKFCSHESSGFKRRHLHTIHRTEEINLKSF